MKRKFFFVVCVMLMNEVFSQQSISTLPRLISQSDSVHYAELNLAEGIALAGQDTSKALPSLRTASDIFKKYRMPEKEGDCHMQIAEIYFKAGQYNRAFGNYLRAGDLFFEVNPVSSAYASFGIAKSQYHRGLYRFAIKNFSEVIEFAVKHKDDQLKSQAAEYLGVIFSIFQSNEQSKAYFTSAFKTNEQLHDDKACLRIAERLFSLHYKDKQFDSALWYCDYSIAIAGKLEQRNTYQNSQLNRIRALIRLMRMKEAGNEIQEFAKIEMTQSDLDLKIRYETIMGSYLLAAGNEKKASMQYDTALRHASATNTPDLMAFVYDHMADAFADQHNYERAYEYGQKYFEMVNDFYSHSISHLSKIESLIREDISDSRIRWLSSLNQIHELELKRAMDSRQSLEMENRLKDSILVKEKQLGKALELEYKSSAQELTSQQKISAMLNKETALQKTQLAKEHTIRIQLIVGIFSLVLLGIFAWSQYNKVRSRNRIIEKQSGELQTLMKEIHHRVKNNLQIISSLLDIQSLNLENNPAAEAIREGRNRVQSMALIHQLLYHENNIRGIQARDYIKNLSEYLFSSYNINKDEIKLETDIDSLNLDVDTMIPLGLIINELLSNSLKYAFNNHAPGKVFIALKQHDNSLQLLVRDNGPGFPAKASEKKSFGLQLIAAFAQKLKARWELYNDAGAVVHIHFKKYKLA